jgi:ArsR family transcriptional regulator, cadmium/lead-responsive transcriptional repressor
MASPAPFQLSPAPSQTEVVAKYFRVLGEPTRLRILELLAQRERSVGQIVEELRLPQPKVSNHLACLRWCGFVASRREHRVIHYRLADERVTQAIELARGLLADSEEHVAACTRIDGASR